MSTLDYSSLDMLWRKGGRLGFLKQRLREQERLYGKERLTVNHTGLKGFNGLILVV